MAKTTTRKRNSNKVLKCTEGHSIYHWPCPHGITTKMRCCDTHLKHNRKNDSIFAALCDKCNPRMTQDDADLLKAMGISL